jgi:hypothetical protein
MVIKNNKTPVRIVVNTGLFILMAIAFGIMTFCGINKLEVSRKNLVGI